MNRVTLTLFVRPFQGRFECIGLVFRGLASSTPGYPSGNPAGCVGSFSIPSLRESRGEETTALLNVPLEPLPQRPTTMGIAQEPRLPVPAKSL